MAIGERAAALQAYERALQIEPTNDQVKFALRQARVAALKQGQAAKASSTAHDSACMSSMEAKEKGNRAFGKKSFAEAAGYYSLGIALAHREDSPVVETKVLRSNRSGAYLGMGYHRLAAEEARRCIALDPAWAKGYSRLGAALLEKGDWEAALSAFEDGLAIDPGNAALQDGLRKAALHST